MATVNSLKFTDSTLNQRFPALTTKDLHDYLIQGCGGPNLAATYHLARVVANTGIQADELEELHLECIDPVRNRIEVPMHNGNHRVRYIPLRPKTFDSLMALHGLNGASDFIFGDFPKHSILRASSGLQSAFPHKKDRANLSNLRWVFAFMLLEAEVPEYLVDYCLGADQCCLHDDRHKMSPKVKCELLARELNRKVEEL